MTTAAESRMLDAFPGPNDRPASCHDDIISEINRLVERMNRDQRFAEQIAEFKNTALVLSATDTGRELMITLGEEGIRARPYAGEPFDVKILATEDVHWAVLSGQMDADAAFFTRKVRISGRISTAFRVKNRFLGLLQQHLAGEPQSRR